MSIALPYRAWLGLGGNMDDPVASMAKALKLLDARTDTNVIAVSQVYRTPPWGKTDQAWFHNACANAFGWSDGGRVSSILIFSRCRMMQARRLS